jgi:hypothetical protein
MGKRLKRMAIEDRDLTLKSLKFHLEPEVHCMDRNNALIHHADAAAQK